MQQLGKARELFVAGALGTVHVAEALVDEGAIGLVAAFVARHRQDAPALGQLAVAEGLEQRRHQLAPGQVASAAEENEIKGHDWTGQPVCNLVT